MSAPDSYYADTAGLPADDGYSCAEARSVNRGLASLADRLADDGFPTEPRPDLSQLWDTSARRRSPHRGNRYRIPTRKEHR